MSEKEEKKRFTLTNKQIKFLKGLGHHLKPLVQVGKEGISESVLEAVEKELLNHELIKVKLGQNCPDSKKDAPDLLSKNTESAVVQLIGKTILLYKPNKKRPKDKRIVIPKG